MTDGRASKRPGFGFPANPAEWRALLLSAAYFFLVLFSFYLLRPIRESMGISRGYDKLPWLMTGTLAAMLLATPLYALAASKWRRRVFIPLTYRFFQANIAVFLLLFWLLPESSHVALGYAFYIWLSVYNLFVVSVFWSVMADIWSREQGTRLFGLVGIGGTLGAMLGGIATAAASKGFTLPGMDEIKLSAPALMACALIPIELAIWCVMSLLPRTAPNAAVTSHEREPSVRVFEGLRLLASRPYLALIGAYILLYSLTSTFLYIEQARLIEETFPDEASRRTAFAQIDVWTNTVTLLVQALITGNLMPRIGIAASLAIVPVITGLGFLALASQPVMSVLAVFQMLRRGLHFAIDRPAREVLFTILGPDEKYKSKNFIDTAIYRAGDMAGSWAAVALTTLSIPVAVALSGLWLFVSVMTGLVHRKEAAKTARE